MTDSKLPTGLHLRTHGDRRFWEAKWIHDGRQVKRRIGPAHVVPDGQGGWKKKRGPAPEGSYTQRDAVVRMGELVQEQARSQGIRRSKRTATFGDAAEGWLDYLRREGRKPSTLEDYRNLLAQPGELKKRGAGEKKARIMRTFGNRSLRSIETADIERFLDQLQDEGLSGRLVNKHRTVLHAIFEFCRKPRSGYGLMQNPVSQSEKRSQQPRRKIEPFTLEELVAIVRAAEKGEHRTELGGRYGEATRTSWEQVNREDAALFLVAAETGLRLGELRALRWQDVHFDPDEPVITVEQAISSNQVATPKSGKARRVPIPDRSLGRLSRLRDRECFTEDRDLVFGAQDGTVQSREAIYRRFLRAQEAAGVKVRRVHDLRHTYCSRLVATGTDLLTVKEWAGHSSIAVTERYLHFQPRKGDAARVTAAFTPEEIVPTEPMTSPQTGTKL